MVVSPRRRQSASPSPARAAVKGIARPQHTYHPSVSLLPRGIRHIIVLMLENRSFDHLLGGVAGVDGPAGGSNIDPADGSAVAVTFDANPTSPALPDPQHPGDVAGDPHHDFIAVNRQLFDKADPRPGDPVTCGGFIMAGRASGDPDAVRIAREVMRCFDTPRTLTTFASLASEFLVCDRWHAFGARTDVAESTVRTRRDILWDPGQRPSPLQRYDDLRSTRCRRSRLGNLLPRHAPIALPPVAVGSPGSAWASLHAAGR